MSTGFNCSFAIISSATFAPVATACMPVVFQLLIRNYFLCNAAYLALYYFDIAEVSIAHSQLFPLQHLRMVSVCRRCRQVSIAHSQLFPLQRSQSTSRKMLQFGFNCSFAIISSATNDRRYNWLCDCVRVSIAHSQLFPLQPQHLLCCCRYISKVSIAHSQLFPLQPRPSRKRFQRWPKGGFARGSRLTLL